MVSDDFNCIISFVASTQEQLKIGEVAPDLITKNTQQGNYKEKLLSQLWVTERSERKIMNGKK